MVTAKVKQLIQVLWVWFGNKALDEIIEYCQMLKEN